MAQKPMTRADVYARALRASQNVIRAEVWAATLLWGGVEELSPCGVAFGQILPRVWFTRFPGRKSSPRGDPRTAPITPGSMSATSACSSGAE